jgi:hypothetical protein
MTATEHHAGQTDSPPIDAVKLIDKEMVLVLHSLCWVMKVSRLGSTRVTPETCSLRDDDRKGDDRHDSINSVIRIHFESCSSASGIITGTGIICFTTACSSCTCFYWVWRLPARFKSGSPLSASSLIVVSYECRPDRSIGSNEPLFVCSAFHLC